MEVAKQRARALREAGLLGEAIAVMREAKRQAKCSASKRVRGETRAGIPKTTVHEQPQTRMTAIPFWPITLGMNSWSHALMSVPPSVPWLDASLAFT